VRGSHLSAWYNIGSDAPFLVTATPRASGKGAPPHPRPFSRWEKGDVNSIPTLINPPHTTRLPSPDRAVRTDRVEVVLVDAVRAGTDPGACGRGGRARLHQQ